MRVLRKIPVPFDLFTELSERRCKMNLGQHLKNIFSEGELFSEINAINGAIPPEAEKYGVPTPYNTVVSALVRAKERRLGLR